MIKNVKFASSPKIARQAGFTLLELLLATAVLGGLMVGTVKLTSNFSEQERAQVAGQQLRQIVDSLEEYVQTVQPAAAGSNNVLDDWPDLKTALVQNGGTLQTRVGGEFRVADRTVGGVRVFAVYTTTPAKFSLASKAARAAGGHGGYAGFQRGSFMPESAYNMWGMTQADINNLFDGLITAPTETTDGYLLAVLRMPTATLFGPYLYREDKGSPIYNTMQTDLLMSGHDVTGVKDVGTQTLTASNSATVGGALTVNGNSSFSNNVTMGNGVNVAGSVTANSAEIVGNLDAGNISATNEINAGVIQASSVAATNIRGDNINIVGSLGASNVVAFGDVTVGGALTANAATVGSVSTSTLNTGDLDVTNRVTSGDLTVNGNTQLNGNVQIDDCLTLAGDNYGGC